MSNRLVKFNEVEKTGEEINLEKKFINSFLEM